MSFPNMTDDLTPLPPLFWQHAYEPNFYIPKECLVKSVNHDLTPNGSVPGLSQMPQQDLAATTDSTPVKLTTHSFRPDAVNDVWSVKIEQIWADFHGMASSKERPVPLLDPFTLNVWMCWPSKDHPTSVSQSQSRIDVLTGPVDSLDSSYTPSNQKPINACADRPASNDENSPSGESAGSRTSSGGRVNSSFEDLSLGESSCMDSARLNDTDGDLDFSRYVTFPIISK